MSGPLVFVDTETTGLDPIRHEIWELAYAVGQGPIQSGVIFHSLRHADPAALAMNGYWDRVTSASSDAWLALESGARVAMQGATLVAANPAFDAAFLRERWGVAPWHHRLFDIEAFAAGVLGLSRPPDLRELREALAARGFGIPEPDHSALGDVHTLRRCYQALRDIQTTDSVAAS